MKTTNVIRQPIAVVVGGRSWFLYSFDYKTPDGGFTGYFYAISDDHAAEVFMDMKATMKLGSRVIECGEM